jgi:hypothetical protein
MTMNNDPKSRKKNKNEIDENLEEAVQNETELEAGEANPEIAELAESLNLDEAARDWNPDDALSSLEVSIESEAETTKAALEVAMETLENRARLEAENLESIDAEIEAAAAAEIENLDGSESSAESVSDENAEVGEAEAPLGFNPLDREELRSNLEALFFMTDKVLSTKAILELLGPTANKEFFEEIVQEMIQDYSAPTHGIELVAVANGYQFRTKAGKMDLAQKLARQQVQRLSRGALETLASPTNNQLQKMKSTEYAASTPPTLSAPFSTKN